MIKFFLIKEKVSEICLGGRIQKDQVINRIRLLGLCGWFFGGLPESLMEGFIPAKIVGGCDMWHKSHGIKQPVCLLGL